MSSTNSSSLIQYKGVIVVLAWVLLVNVCDPSVAQSVNGPKTLRSVLISPSIFIFLVCFLLPVVTLVADIKIGGCRFTKISLVFGFLTSVSYLISNILDMYGHTTSNNPSQMLLYISFPFHILFRRSFTVFMVLYGTDLMPDASSEQLSSYIWCYYWCKYIGLLITVVLTCDLGKHFSADEGLGLLIIDGIHILCLILAFISCVAFKRLVTSNFSKKQNPLKLIKDVILFAKRHPYPLNRSALTYWENSIVSRINNGKRKYGGPFEEEDVESVKSFFRLLPILACISLIYFPPVPLGRLKHSDPTTFECLVGSTYFTEYVVVLFCISCKLLVLRSSHLCSYSRFGMLSRIGLGILLMLLSKVAYVVTSLYVNFLLDDNTTCFSRHDKNETENSGGLVSVSYTLILPQIVGSVGTALALPTSLEFIFAQCPYSMRGLLLGLLFSVYDIQANLGWDSLYLYSFIPNGMPGCEFYVYLTHVFVILVCFLLFTYLKRWYKLRLRNEVFFHYSAAERYYTNLIRNRSET